jgi:hypothetical protein
MAIELHGEEGGKERVLNLRSKTIRYIDLLIESKLIWYTGD